MNKKDDDLEKVKLYIQKQLPITIKTYTFSHEMEEYVKEILSYFLEYLNQSSMFQYLSYSIYELIVNAKKANTKRIYFNEKKLDINNPTEYEQGIATFKEDTLNNINYYLNLQKEAGLYIKLILQYYNEQIIVKVVNNSKLTETENQRIKNKLEQAKKYDKIGDAFSSVLDDTEGAGLGLIILILMLKKVGLSDENFSIYSTETETVTKIIIPIQKETKAEINTISQEFSKCIEDLPQFPENIIKINNLLNNPKSDISEIATLIASDVSLTAELLKTVNSATFALQNPCSNITEAVKLLGIQGIQNLLYAVGSLQIFKYDANNNFSLWEHSNKVAFFSYNLCKNLCNIPNSTQEDAFVCGLLHDMGKVIFQVQCPAYIESVREVCQEKNISLDLFEKILSGVNHSKIGAMIAEKWNFPKKISSVIKHHHTPNDAEEEYKLITSIIYLADLMVHYTEKTITYNQIDKKILAMHNINSESAFSQIATKILNCYQK